MTFDINGVAHLFQIALTPAFLLAGTGALLGLASSRLSAGIERSRSLHESAKRNANEKEYQQEFQALDRSTILLYRAFVIGLFSAFFTSLVITTLFCGQFISLGGSIEVIASAFFALATLTLSISILLIAISVILGKRIRHFITNLEHEE